MNFSDINYQEATSGNYAKEANSMEWYNDDIASYRDFDDRLMREAAQLRLDPVDLLEQQIREDEENEQWAWIDEKMNP